MKPSTLILTPNTLAHHLFTTHSIPELLEIITTGPRASETASWACEPHTYHHCANMALAAAYAALTEDMSV